MSIPLLLYAALCSLATSAARADLADAIVRIKPSVVLVGSYRFSDSPRFAFRGSGLVVSDDLGLCAATDLPNEELLSLDLRTVREQTRRQARVGALEHTDGSIVKAAEILGVSRPNLYDLINRLQIK